MTTQTQESRRWTTEDIGRSLTAHFEREKIMEANIKDISEVVKELRRVVIEGDGDTPSIRDQVRAQQKWIDNANKLMWIVATALIGQIVVGGCSLLVAIMFLVNGGGQ